MIGGAQFLSCVEPNINLTDNNIDLIEFDVAESVRKITILLLNIHSKQ